MSRLIWGLKIMELDEWMNRIGEFKAMSQQHEDGLDEFRKNSARHRLNTFIKMKMNSMSSRANSASLLKIV